MNLLHLGIGKVGKALVRQILENKDRLKKNNLDLIYCGIFDYAGGIFDPAGLSDRRLISFPQNAKLSVEIALNKIPKPFILIDTTASDETHPYLISALKSKGGAVLSNKKPLSSSQKKFDQLHQAAQGRLFYETTVGAALPVISTLKDLVDTGDEIIEIRGCFSGTLGFLFSQLDKEKRFSEAVLQAKELGFTEPDPRDDLSGLDVARKALILARLMGLKIEISDIKLEKLYKKDDYYKKRLEKEKKKGKVLRYAASISNSGCRVGIESVDKNSDLGSLDGPDNMIIFKTQRYFDHPLVIKGPGAGVEITASGVFSDILKAARILKANL